MKSRSFFACAYKKNRCPIQAAGLKKIGHVILILVDTEEYPSLAEGIGLENRQGCQSPRGFESLFLRHY